MTDEEQSNHELAGGRKTTGTIADAPYRLTHAKIKRNLNWKHFRRKIERLCYAVMR